MELYIETLSGTSYELRVSPFEPIISVKAKIQRLGGIPMSQQHLIWRSTELEDDFSLADYKVHNGATLRLVLAMRGGPINTRRIPIEDPAIKEMAEYMDSNKDEFGTNRQLTLLVFREGDQLNFFRVMDRGDGTLTPLSESLSGTSVYNLNDDEDDDGGATKEKKDENDRLKVKVNELRVKMEQLSLTKKSCQLQRVSTTHELPSPRLSSASSQRHLPPVKSIKKSSKRCLTCSKKTGLASSYQCRCGNNFCSAHRYAETHDCTFDYKAEGRKIIRQNNPVIKASKLPKI
uniref:AN1-type domain-containing protein n=1 Tax=Octopus bimaculoides TaxID=37653 RepID=A0A0L8HD01_OCTBM